MITTLHIKNIGIIDDLSVELNNGFNVFTGETGAGKTLIIDAINIISGGRFSKEMIRRGEEYSFVELNLYLPDNERAIDGNVIVSREIHINGRNSCKINGRLVTVTELKEFMNNVIDIHGQNDNQKILSSKYHIKYLDDFCGADLAAELSKYQELYNQYNKLKAELKNNYGDDKEKKRRLDLLQYEFDEIDKADLKLGEEETLNERRVIFQNAEKIGKSLNESSQEIDNAVECINGAIKSLDKIESLDKKYSEMLTELKGAYYEIEEISRDISDMNLDIDFNEEERNEVEERLDMIYSLKRKYGNSVKEILEYKDNIEKEINYINNSEEINKQLKNQINKLTKEMEEYSTKINQIRQKFPNSKINGSLEQRLPGNCNLCFSNINSGELLLKLDAVGICASGGSACSSGDTAPSHVLSAIGVPNELARGALRVTFGDFNTKDDVDYLIAAIAHLIPSTAADIMPPA